MRVATMMVVPVVAAAILGGCGGDGGLPELRLDGIGPLKLGMASGRALKTHWLAKPKFGCKLGGQPLPVVYETTGPDAPAGLTGHATLHKGRVVNITFNKGVMTSEGVTPGKTSVSEMRKRYSDAGFRVESAFDEVFQTTFVTVRRGQAVVLMASAAAKTIDSIGAPSLPLCE